MTRHTQNRASPRRQGASSAGRSRGDAPKPGARAQIALGWAALVVVLAGILRNGAFEPVAWTILCLATLFIFAVQAVLDIRHGLSRPARMALWLVLPYGAVLLWLLLQGRPGFLPGLAHPFWDFGSEGSMPAMSAHPDGGGQVVMRLTCYGLLFWIFLRSAAAAPRGGLAYIQVLAVFSAALAIYGMVSLQLGYNVLLGADEKSSILRASFFNRNTFATFAVFGVLASVTSFVQSMSTSASASFSGAIRDFFETFFERGWIYAFSALFGLAAVAMSLSRGGAVAGLLGLVVLAWAQSGRKGKVPPVVFAIPIVLVGFTVLFMSSGTVERFGGTDASSDSRAAVYGKIVEGISDRPWIGHGAGAFQDAFRPYVPPEYARLEWGMAHNSYLENGFEFGLPAAAVFYLALASIGWRLLRGVVKRRRNQVIPAFALSCFAAGSAHATVDFSLQFPALAALFAAILGIGWGQSFASRCVSRKGSEASLKMGNQQRAET